MAMVGLGQDREAVTHTCVYVCVHVRVLLTVAAWSARERFAVCLAPSFTPSLTCAIERRGVVAVIGGQEGSNSSA